MATFNYKARNNGGEMLSGVLEAADRSAALSQINAMGLFPVSVESTSGEGGSSGSHGEGKQRKLFQRGPAKPSLKDLANFTRQLANLLNAGMPLTGALSSMTNMESSEGIPPDVSRGLFNEVREGKTLSNAMALYPHSFPDMYLNMVKAGETSGSMVEVLKRLADHYERFAEVRSKVTTALVYPLFVMSLGFALMFVFMSYILPKFMAIFKGMDVTLPMSTKILQGISDFMSQQEDEKFYQAGWPWVLFFGVVFSMLVKRYFATPNGKKRLHEWLLTAPLVSRIARPTYFGQFARTLGALLKNGVPVLTALKITENVVQNVILQGAIAMTREGVTDGKTIAEPLGRSGVFPKLMVDLVHIGEQTGDVPAALDNLADTYDNKLNTELRVVTTLIEPILIVVIAGAVGFMLVGVLQAMFKITSSIGKT